MRSRASVWVVSRDDVLSMIGVKRDEQADKFHPLFGERVADNKNHTAAAKRMMRYRAEPTT